MDSKEIEAITQQINSLPPQKLQDFVMNMINSFTLIQNSKTNNVPPLATDQSTDKDKISTASTSSSNSMMENFKSNFPNEYEQYNDSRKRKFIQDLEDEKWQFLELETLMSSLREQEMQIKLQLVDVKMEISYLKGLKNNFRIIQ